MKKWEILASEEPIETIDQIIAILLYGRGLKTKKERDEFLRPILEKVTIKEVGIDFKHLNLALNRLQFAFDKKELIIIYGDYDVDGITGTAILWEALIALGFKVMPYIPHRVDEGYGLSEKGIDNLLIQYPDTKLIITVDNGIVASQAVKYAKKNSLDVIITDHHLPDKEHEMPDALALVHTTKLCGAGVAWLLSKEIQKQFGIQEMSSSTSTSTDNNIDTHLELAALGTVADLVSLTGANRAIVFHGLKLLGKTKRLGLAELYERAGIDVGKIGVYEIGHVIGPRLNAAGRLESAMDSLRLLCTHDKNRAKLLAESLDVTNSQRQLIMRSAVEHAKSKIKNQKSEIKKVLIISEESYEEGIIGLVAGRLVDEFYRPSIVIAKREEVSKGSVRSVSGFNIIEFLRSKSDLFINVGGHPMAAGFSVDSSRLLELQEKLEEYAEEKISDDLLERKIKINMELPFNLLSDDLYLKLQDLSPFGMGNPEPVFLSKHVLVREKRVIGKEGKHLRMILQGGEVGRVIEAIAFGMGDRSSQIVEEGYIDVVYALDENNWKGNTRLQLKIKDFS